MPAAQICATNINEKCFGNFCLMFWLALRVFRWLLVFGGCRRTSLFRQGLLIVPMFWSDRRGVGAWEYAVLAALLGLVLVTVLQTPVHELSEVIGNWMGGDASGGGGGTGGAVGR